MTERVLVTGGSGFVAGHCIAALLEAGYAVRATLRSLDREPEVRRALLGPRAAAEGDLSFAEADLTRDEGWRTATEGCDHVLHVASPVIAHGVKDDAFIQPAREGTLRVLRAARDSGLRRVVLTSAFHAVGFGHPHTHPEFTEDDWSIMDSPGVDAYGRSKIIAERAAWEFVGTEGGDLRLTTLLPVAIMGPTIGPANQAASGANEIIERSLAGRFPGYPNLFIPIVDVRDVAAAHVAALTADGVAGQRILICTGEPAMAMGEIGSILRDEFGAAAAKVPTRRIPDLVIRLAALFRPEYRPVAADLGFVKQVSNERATRLLGLTFRPSREAVAAAGASLIGESRPS